MGEGQFRGGVQDAEMTVGWLCDDDENDAIGCQVWRQRMAGCECVMMKVVMQRCCSYGVMRARTCARLGKHRMRCLEF